MHCHVPPMYAHALLCSPCPIGPWQNGSTEEQYEVSLSELLPHTVFFWCLSLCAFWGHRFCPYINFIIPPPHPSQACNCSVVGSTGPQCDVLSGQCHCKEGFGGQSCDQCSLGYRRFPDCVPCDCDPRGTLADTCALEQGLCSCTEDSGACSCKVLVVHWASVSFLWLPHSHSWAFGYLFTFDSSD